MSLRSYWLCGQYPGAVGLSQTVSLYCASDLPPSRYVVVQYPYTGISAYFCEVEVFALGQQSSDIHHYLTNNTVLTVLWYSTCVRLLCIAIMQLTIVSTSHMCKIFYGRPMK